MKILSVEKIIIYALVIISLVFGYQLVSDYKTYSEATECIKNKDYTEAIVLLEKLDNYKDAEILKEYSKIMSKYDSKEFVSIYHCYRGLEEIESRLVNKRLAEEFAKTTTEVETLYKHYNVSLSVKTSES